MLLFNSFPSVAQAHLTFPCGLILIKAERRGGFCPQLVGCEGRILVSQMCISEPTHQSCRNKQQSPQSSAARSSAEDRHSLEHTLGSICGTQLVTDLQLIPLNTLFPPQFISVLKVLRYLIVPPPQKKVQHPSIKSLLCLGRLTLLSLPNCSFPFAGAVKQQAITEGRSLQLIGSVVFPSLTPLPLGL